MATRDENTNDQSTVLGDINPEPGHSTLPTWPDRKAEKDDEWDEEKDRTASEGSTHDRTRHPGSRDVTEGTTGGTGTEVGGTRNLRTGSGATGTDLGGRPE
jgi:hypothetical protein